MNALLTTLLMVEEKFAVWAEARQEADKEYQPGSSFQRLNEEAALRADSEGDPNSHNERESLGHYWGLLLKAMKEVGRSPGPN